MINFSIRTKIIVMVAGALLLAILSAAYMMRALVYRNILAQKMTTVGILTTSLVNEIKHDLSSHDHVLRVEDRGWIKEIIGRYMTHYRMIKGISFYDTDYTNMVDSDPQNIGKETQDKEIVKAITLTKAGQSFTRSDSANFCIRSVSPISLRSKVIGALVLNISIQDIEAIMSSIDHQILIVLIVTVLVACTFLFFLLRHIILRRLNRLMEVTHKIAAGNYDIQIIDIGEDELGQLAQAFYRTTFEIHKSKKEIEDNNQHLRLQTDQLNKAYQELKSTQSQLVLNEKMASLGVLIAGIAHEINTPVGAMHNIAGNLEERIFSFSRVLESFKKDPDLAAETLSECLQEVIQSSLGDQHVASLREIRTVETLLKDQGIDNYRKVSSVLAQLNFMKPDSIMRFVNLFGNHSLFSLVESIGSIAQAIKIVQTSSQKIGEIVRALKYYAHPDKNRMEMVQLNESIETALILLTNKLKHRVKVATELDPEIPKLPCTSEIHQVWTNLLSNACDAVGEMGEDDRGEISVRSLKADDQIVVTIADNGIGIPEDKIDKIFDPFFTTKEIGKGTGLGLSIVSGIVKKHKGTIQVESRRGHTIFKIRFPLSVESDKEYEQDRTACYLCG